MASIAMMAGGVLVNALAFSGTNFVFSQIGDHGAAERKRNYLLAKARDQYNRKRLQRLGFINKTLRDRHHAEHTFSDLEAAMDKYYEMTGDRLTPLGDPPKLIDFNNPSRKEKDAELLFVAGGMALVEFLAYKYA